MTIGKIFDTHQIFLMDIRFSAHTHQRSASF